MIKKIIFVLLGIIVVTGLIIGGCGEAEETTTTPPKTTAPTTTAPPTDSGPKYGGTFRFIADSSPRNIGWAPDTFTMVGSFELFDGLVKDWWNGEVTGALAESWDIDMDEPSLTFHLRKGVTFHDGTPMNAEAVKFNYDYFIEAKKRPEWESIEVIDEYTVKIVMNVWKNTLLRQFESDPVVSPTAVKEHGIDWAVMNPVGTGPFILEEFVQDVHMTMTRNPNYWDDDKPYLDRFEIIYIPDYTTKKTALLAGEADSTLVEFGKQSHDFMDVDGFELWVQPQATAFMIFDDAHPDSPFYDQRVREAVDYAVDREWLAENLGYGLAEPCYQLSPRPNLAYDPNYVGRQRDIEKAKQLLADAGYSTGLKTQLLPNPLALNRDIWIAIQSQLAEAGIDAELKFLDSAAFSEIRTPGIWENAIVGDQCPSWGNMAIGLNMMFGTGPFYNSSDKNRPDWVEAITAATTSANWDPGLNRTAEQILYKNATVVPVMEVGRGYVYRDNLRDHGIGERGAYFWAWDWESAWLDD